MDLRSLVAERYNQLEKCYGHCDQPATLRFLNDEASPVITGYSCHGAYLSRIIIYAPLLRLQESVDAITQLLGPESDVKQEDVRIASRYPWDMDITTDGTGKVMMMAYWTQNYRRTKNEDPGREAIFLCAKCSTVFLQKLSDRQVLCTGCRN